VVLQAEVFPLKEEPVLMEPTQTVVVEVVSRIYRCGVNNHNRTGGNGGAVVVVKGQWL
jgi:hypothetical protein